MTQYHVVVASKNSVYLWQYRTPVSKLTSVPPLPSLLPLLTLSLVLLLLVALPHSFTLSLAG
jgi:hypothetical protein